MKHKKNLSVQIDSCYHRDINIIITRCMNMTRSELPKLPGDKTGNIFMGNPYI
jgi:hypothetical protein